MNISKLQIQSWPVIHESEVKKSVWKRKSYKVFCVKISVPEKVWEGEGKDEAAGGEYSNDTEAGIDDAVTDCVHVHGRRRNATDTQESSKRH